MDGAQGFVLEGVVVRGDGRGRQLGYPTANVAAPPSAMPDETELPDGVYAGFLRRSDGTVLPAAVSVGRRPTFYGADGERLVEAYLLDVDVELYDERVEILVGERVRGQGRFASSEELVVQMAADVAAVRDRIAAGRSPRPWPGRSDAPAQAGPEPTGCVSG
jgi:riboflavin kinase/FMN adenylyltransferase